MESVLYLLQENTPAISKQQGILHDGPVMAAVTEGDTKVTVERELVSQVEEEDMEALLGTYVLCFKLIILPSSELITSSLSGFKIVFQCSSYKQNKESIVVPKSLLGEITIIIRNKLWSRFLCAERCNI